MSGYPFKNFSRRRPFLRNLTVASNIYKYHTTPFHVGFRDISSANFSQFLFVVNGPMSLLEPFRAQYDHEQTNAIVSVKSLTCTATNTRYTTPSQIPLSYNTLFCSLRVCNDDSSSAHGN